MKRIIIFFCLALFCRIGISQILYPEVYSCFGGHSAGSNVQLTWTAGEPLFETATNAKSILTQGFNQLLHVISTDVNIEQTDAKFRVFPNPCKDRIWIEFSLLKEDDAILKLFDLSGNVLLKSQIWADAININFTHFVKLQDEMRSHKNKINPTIAAALYTRN